MKEIFESRYLHQRNAIEISFYGNEPRLLLKFESLPIADCFARQIASAASAGPLYKLNAMETPIISKRYKKCAYEMH